MESGGDPGDVEAFEEFCALRVIKLEKWQREALRRSKRVPSRSLIRRLMAWFRP